MKQLTLRLVAVCIGMIAFFGLGEAVIRIYGAATGYAGDDPRFGMMAPDPVRMMTLKKNYHGRVFNKQGEFDNEFSTNSFTTEAGLSTTSPAAICEATSGERIWIGMRVL